MQRTTGGQISRMDAQLQVPADPGVTRLNLPLIAIGK